MIFVTLGTNDKKFDRLLRAVEHAIQQGWIQEEVIVQSGFTPFQSDVMKVVDYFTQDDFLKYLQEARFVICHGGVGSIMNALEYHKKILAAPRLAKYGEHVNDHQTQLLESFEQAGYLVYLKDFEDFEQALQTIEFFIPKEFQSNQAHMIDFLNDWIKNHA